MQKGKGIGPVGVSYDYTNMIFFSDTSGEHPTHQQPIESEVELSNVRAHAKEVLNRDEQPIDAPTVMKPKSTCKSVTFSVSVSTIVDDPVFVVPPIIVAEKVDIPPDISHDLVADLGLGEEEPSGPDEFDRIDVNPELPESEGSLFWSVLKKFRNVFRPAWGLLNDGDTMPI